MFCFIYRMETVNVSIVETVCTVNSAPMYEVCLDTSERVFFIAPPTPYPSDMICYWNIPEPDTGIYVSLTGRGIHQVSGSCDDRLMIQSDAFNEDLVTCGNSQGLPAVINNDFLQSGVETFFVSNAANEGVGFEMLVAYFDPPVGKVYIYIYNTVTECTLNLGCVHCSSKSVHLLRFYREMQSYSQESALIQQTFGGPGKTLLLQLKAVYAEPSTHPLQLCKCTGSPLEKY